MLSTQVGPLSHVDQGTGMVSAADARGQIPDLGEGVSVGGRRARGEVSRRAHCCPLQAGRLDCLQRSTVPQRERPVLRGKIVGVDGRDPGCTGQQRGDAHPDQPGNPAFCRPVTKPCAAARKKALGSASAGATAAIATWCPNAARATACGSVMSASALLKGVTWWPRALASATAVLPVLPPAPKITIFVMRSTLDRHPVTDWVPTLGP